MKVDGCRISHVFYCFFSIRKILIYVLLENPDGSNINRLFRNYQPLADLTHHRVCLARALA